MDTPAEWPIALLPYYAHALALSKFQSGVLVGCYGAGSFAAAVPAGFVASRFGTKEAMLFGLGLLALMSVIFGFASSLWLLDLSRFGQGVGATFCWTGARAWLMAAAPRQHRGQLMGFAIAAAATGALLGPAVGTAATVVGTRLERDRPEQRAPLRRLRPAQEGGQPTADGQGFRHLPSPLARTNLAQAHAA